MNVWTVTLRAFDKPTTYSIYENNTLYPIEVKTDAEPGLSDIKHFSMLDSIKGVTIGEGGVICMANDILPLKGKNYIIPLWAA